MANIDTGSRPSSSAATAMPARVWVCITTLLVAEFAMWMAEWMTKPARFTGWSAWPMTLPSTSIFTRFEAVISS